MRTPPSRLFGLLLDAHHQPQRARIVKLLAIGRIAQEVTPQTQEAVGAAVYVFFLLRLRGGKHKINTALETLILRIDAKFGQQHHAPVGAAILGGVIAVFVRPLPRFRL